MTTKIDSFNDEYIEMNANDAIETIKKFVNQFVARECKHVRDNIAFTNYNHASMCIARNAIVIAFNNELSRFYIDDLRDDVYTYFHSHDDT